MELRPAAAAAVRRGARWPWIAAGGLGLGAVALAAVLLLRPAAPPPAVPPAVPPPGPSPVAEAPAPVAPPVAPPVSPPAATPAPPVPPSGPPPGPPPEPAFPLRSADEAAILADAAAQLTLFRFAPEPAVVVLDFPTLEQQGRTLNRVAAFIEKAGLPRDRVLTDAELDAAIRAHGDTVASFYYGHDYPAAALARFFALADRDRVALGPEEERLRALLRQLGWLVPDGAAPAADPPAGALISLSRQGADPDITPSVRATILHHELSHGAFFAEPAYADYVRHFWDTALTAAERAAVLKFLGSEDYDAADATLMVNEMQAYLMFTDDPRFFVPSSFGMTEARRAALRAAFRRDLPLGWLREALAAADARAADVKAAVPAAASAAAAAGSGDRRSLSSPSASAPHQPAAAHH